MGLKFIALLIIYPAAFVIEHFDPHYIPRRHHLRHSFYNLSVSLLNGLAGLFIISWLNQRLTGFISLNNLGLLNFRVLPLWLRFALVFLLFDFWMYLSACGQSPAAVFMALSQVPS